jgi:hypothetical protein
MGHRQPTAILEAKGAFIAQPGRARPLEPTTDRPIGDAPEYMSEAEKKVWAELVAQSCPGVLFESDRLMFAVLVRLATKFQSGKEMKIMETNQMMSLSGKFAMNPADRSKVNVEKPKTSSLSLFLMKGQSTLSEPAKYELPVQEDVDTALDPE